jgi:single-strand DNA-binding protein
VTSKGEKQTLAEYHNLVAWGRLAEICDQYLKKGKLVYAEGYLKTRSWDSPEGAKIFKTEIVIYDMIMLEKRPYEEGHASHDDFYPEGENAFDPGPPDLGELPA